MATKQTEILNTRFRTAQDIDNFFKSLGSYSGFVDWWNKNHAKKGYFDKFEDSSGRIRHGRGPLNVGNRWQNIWNEINVLYNKPEINLVEFLALNTIIINESSSFKASSEYYGTKGYSGIAYTYSRAGGRKRSYNTLSDAGNKTCFTLFNDPVYVKAHGRKKYGKRYKYTKNSKWKTDEFPPGNESKETSGDSSFISEADFHKYRGRGFIQLTGRGNYAKIIKFILAYKGNNSVIKSIRSDWKKRAGSSSVDKIATVSTNAEWDKLFQKTNNIVAAYSLWAHAERTKYSWITPTDDERKLRNDIRNVAKRIAGAGAKGYHDVFEGRVFQQINSILGEEDAFQNTAPANTEDANDNSGGATSDTGQPERRSYADSNQPGQGGADLPKVEGLTNFFKPTTAVPPPISFNAGPSKAHAKKIKNTVGNMPFIHYNGLQFEPQYVKSFSMEIKELLPTVKITFEDQYGLMNNSGVPLDDSKITIFINSRSPAIKSVFMRFKITSFNNSGNTYVITGVSDINRMFLRKFESYSNMTSFECLQEFAKRAGLGFNSNVTESDDKMTWINPGMKGSDFVKDVIAKSYRSDSSFIWCYVDAYYNLNYIDVEEAFKIDISSDIGIQTLGYNNIEDFKDDNEVINLVLTNDKSMSNSNHYFEKFTLVNNSTSISLQKGYLNKVKFFDINTLNFNIFDIDSITSEGDKTIIMKASPQDEEYFKEHVTTTYVGKLDSANMHKNYNYAIVQNKQNIEDIQKVGIKVHMTSPNFNLYRFQKVKVLLSNKGETPTHGISNDRLSGEWLIIDINYIQMDNTFKQVVTLVKRELELSPNELSAENPASRPNESASSENTTNPDNENPLPDEDGDGVPDAIPEDEVIEWKWEIEWANTNEIEKFFRQYNTNGFVGWFAKEFGNSPTFTDNPTIEVGDSSATQVGGDIKHDEGAATEINKQRWTKIWNAITTIYNNVRDGEKDNPSKQTVNGIEYLALNTLIYNLTGTDFKATKEVKNIQESFRAYNQLKDNETAYKLFNDKEFQETFGNQPFASILKDTTDDRWKSDTFPIGFSGGDKNDKELSEENNGYITNADFYKFKRRGILPVIGREKYLDLVTYITNYKGENKILKEFSDKWTKKAEQVNENIEVTQDVKNTNKNRKTRATTSTSKDWDKILLDSDMNPAIIASISNFFFAKKEQHVFDSGRAEDKVFKSIENIGRAVKEEIPNFNVERYVQQVKEQIAFLDKTELPKTKGVEGSPNPVAQKPSNPADISGLKSGGKFDSFRAGKKIGNEDTVIYQGVLIAKKVAPALLAMVADAKKDGVKISVNSAFRTNEDQIVNGKRRSGQNYLYDIWTHTGNNKKLPGKKHYTYPGHSPTSPPVSRTGNLAAVPGTSNHQNGIALDLNTGAKSGSPQYEWLVANAWKYGFIRAVQKERWHWEYRPGERMFSKVPLEHNVWVKAAGKKENTWDNLPQKYGLA
jgi:hypothetical protein